MSTKEESGSWNSPAPTTLVSRSEASSGEPADPWSSREVPIERLLFQELLASGGMGSVVHAYDLSLCRHVAVKVPHLGLREHPAEAGAFVREAMIAAQLDHPNLVPVHELLRAQDGTPVGFTMKLVQGQSLADRLAAQGEQRLEEANLQFSLEVLSRLCDALSFAHARGVLHLDLKPSNVMIGSHGQAYLMDWGIAVRCTRDAKTGLLRPVEPLAGVRGTPRYMAPEQRELPHSELDERTDVYGLGGILHEILTGEAPLAGGRSTVREYMQLQVDQHPPGARKAPPGLVTIAARALSNRPDERYQNVEALKLDLERLRRGGGWFAVRDFAPGEVIAREGEPGDEAYILVAGACNVLKQVGETQRLVRVLGPGDVFGEMALLTGGFRTATVVAASAITAWVVSREMFQRELPAQGWCGALLRALAQRFLEVDRERVTLLEALDARGV